MATAAAGDGGGMAVDVRMLSGALLTTVHASPGWRVGDVKRAIEPQLADKRGCLLRLLLGARELHETERLAELEPPARGSSGGAGTWLALDLVVQQPPGAEHVAELKSRDTAVRLAAIRSLQELGADGTAHATALTVLFTDRIDGVRAAAAVAVGKMGTEDAAGAAAGCLASADWRARWGGAKALELVGGEAATPHVAALARLLSDQWEPIRPVAARALGNIGANVPAQHVALLQTCVWDGKEDLREAAAEALGRIYYAKGAGSLRSCVVS